MFHRPLLYTPKSLKGVRRSRGASFAIFICEMPDQPRRKLWDWAGCLLIGHYDMVAHARGRLRLRCADCGRETPGWRLGHEPGPTQRERQAVNRTRHVFRLLAPGAYRRPLESQ